GHGYLMATRDGGVWSFGDGPALTNLGGYTVRTVGGQATLRFSSDTTGDSTVGASIGGSPATATATPVTVHWASGPPAWINLTGGQEAAAHVDWRNPSPDLRIVLGATPTTVVAGGEVAFTATVSSSGSVAATGARLTVPLPAGSSVGRVDPGDWSCDTDGGSLLCDTGPLANPGSSTLHFQLTMGATPTNVSVSATVTPANGPDFSPADNTTQRSIRIVAAPTAVTLTQSAATAVVGDAHQVTATADGADGTVVTFGVDTPPGPLAGGPYAAFAPTPDGTG